MNQCKQKLEGRRVMDGIKSWKLNILAGETGVGNSGKCSASLCTKEALINKGKKANVTAECLRGGAKRQMVTPTWHSLPSKSVVNVA